MHRSRVSLPVAALIALLAAAVFTVARLPVVLGNPLARHQQLPPPSPPSSPAPEPLAKLAHPTAVISVAFSGDGRYLAAGGGGPEISVWELGPSVRTSARKIRGLEHLGGLAAPVALSQDGRYLAGGRGGVRALKEPVSIDVWRTDTWDLIWKVPRPFNRDDGSDDVRSLAFSPDGRVLYAGHWGGGVTAHRFEGRQSRVIRPPDTMGSAMAMRPDGRELAAAGSPGTYDVKFFNTSTGQPMGELTDELSLVSELAYSRDGRLLAAGDAHAGLCVWDLSMRRRLALVPQTDALGGVLSVAIHRDARHIVFLRGAGVLSIMELGLATAGRPVRLPDLPWTVRFSPNGDVLALGAGSHVYLYASSTLFAVGPS